MREVGEWIGKTPEQDLPERVFIRIFKRQQGRCHACTRKLRPGHITREHLKPISMGGENREANIRLFCTVPCSSSKTAQEAPGRAKADRVIRAHVKAPKPATRQRGRPLPGTKASGWKHKANGTWVRREK